MMKKSVLLAALLVAFGGSAVHAQTPPAKDPVVQLRAEEKAVRKTYSDKKKALDAPRSAEVRKAGDKAAADATAKGQDPAVARRDAEAKVRSATKSDYDGKLKALKKDRDDSLAQIRQKYPATPTPGTSGTPR
jgi:hypothetical protein